MTYNFYFIRLQLSNNEIKLEPQDTIWVDMQQFLKFKTEKTGRTCYLNINKSSTEIVRQSNFLCCFHCVLMVKYEYLVVISIFILPEQALGRLGGTGIVAECEELRSKQLYHSTQDSEKKSKNKIITAFFYLTKLREFESGEIKFI